MLSEKPITVKEFQEKVKLFAQELVNKVSERFPETSVRVKKKLNYLLRNW
ncbi:hypothetical protein [Escherichia phage BYEP02]|nr:hypothetical protein [Escherichia phage BYEP02]